jgi:glycerophosphoryl diester phosphodiesterase
MNSRSLVELRRRIVGPSPITFAHRGAPRARREQNTLAAFERALELGACGVESDIALTADGVPVLVHPSLAGRGPRVALLRRAELPASIPTLADLYTRCGTAFELSLDMGRPQAVEAVVETAERFAALDRLWLSYWRIGTLSRWRERWPAVRLVYPTVPLSPRRARGVTEQLASVGVDALNLYHPFCTARAVERGDSRGLLVFAWGVKRGRTVRRILRTDADGVFADNVEAMVSIAG